MGAVNCRQRSIGIRLPSLRRVNLSTPQHIRYTIFSSIRFTTQNSILDPAAQGYQSSFPLNLLVLRIRKDYRHTHAHFIAHSHSCVNRLTKQVGWKGVLENKWMR